MSIIHNPPTLWLTINLSNTNDPIVKVLAGCEIDLNDFKAHMGPNKSARAINTAKDPYATAKYFHITINLILEELFGIKVTGYMGAVEAQGRGTLHLHMLLWLVGAPTPSEMKDLLQQEEFHEKITAFIKANVTAHVDGLCEAKLQCGVKTREEKKFCKKIASPYSRPLDPRKPDFDALLKTAEYCFAQQCHIHTCSQACLKVG
ncbi:hypothetical protein M422DRAFT_267034 [Sphaerobolus stellatus SS14]|uniref:Helitron helicase-like domain-containing protein n=1 Tax=Sphaerobolus stellatus (strain SS14) TaxID=990650 RepID=A0A0C9V1B7_SPHS4|nr:hypothetical protein M422DRAFT_267034 [Sphaerobolus stellatus SS14]